MEKSTQTICEGQKEEEVKKWGPSVEVHDRHERREHESQDTFMALKRVCAKYTPGLT